MLDFCVGLDTEFSEIVEGSHLYYPKTKFDQVDRQTDRQHIVSVQVCARYWCVGHGPGGLAGGEGDV